MISTINEQYVLDPEVLEATTHCEKTLRCIHELEPTMCKVVFSVNDSVLGIYCMTDNACSYKYSVEERNYCACPVRKYLYNHYKI
jgi:hypothetical protein